MPQSPADGTLSVLVLRALVAGAAFHGIDRERLIAECGVTPAALDPETLMDPDARIPARIATGREIFPSKVELQHQQPADTTAHRPIFGPNIHFRSERDAISFDRATSELPVVGADPALGELVMAHARALYERLPEDTTWTSRVQRLVGGELPRSMLGIDDVATRLSVPKRTLQRRLKEEGTSFEELTDALRRQLAERYLREQRLGVQETAFLLGYSDVSAFHRAFQRWTGVSPTRFRADLGSPGV